MKFFKSKKAATDKVTRSEPLPVAEAFPPREHRIRILPLHDILFTLTDTGEKIELGNLSVTGAGFLRESRREWPPVGSFLSGEFTYRKNKYPVELEIKHISTTNIGCDCTESSGDSMRKLVIQYFDIELNALQLVRIDSQYIKQHHDGESSWFRGPNNCEIFLVEKDKKVTNFTISFFGNHIEGGEQKRLSIGTILGDDGEGKIGIKKADLIQQVDDSSLEIITHTLKFVANANALTPRQKSALNSYLSESLKK